MSRQVVADIVRRLRNAINDEGDGLTPDILDDSIDEIEDLLPGQFHYDHSKFPRLINTKSLTMGSIDTPQNLAEAYIWKQGDWKKYQKFVCWYYCLDARPPRNRIVLYAFAKHLRDPRLPIFDQHVLRSMWAISDALWHAPGDPCMSYLVRPTVLNWKVAGGGPSAVECYNLYCAAFAAVQGTHGISRSRLDQLLWSLGKALKTYSRDHTGGRTNDYDEFCDIINR